MPTHCFDPIYGKMLRVSELNSCGVAIPDTGQQVTTDGFVSVSITAETEDGAEIIVRKANGAICINEKQANSFKRLTLEIHFCGVNPSLLALVSNANPYVGSTAEEILGFTLPEGELNKWFSFELWTGITGAACEPGATEQSGYMLLPFVNAGTLGDLEITGEDAIDFSVTGAYTKGGNGWGVGLYNDVYSSGAAAPSALPTPLDPFDHFLLIDNYGPIPEPSCGPIPIPSGVVATGATAGTPGTFTPAGATAPANIGALSGVTASPTEAWTSGQHVVLGDTSLAHWDGAGWVAGAAAAAAGDGGSARSKKQLVDA